MFGESIEDRFHFIQTAFYVTAGQAVDQFLSIEGVGPRPRYITNLLWALALMFRSNVFINLKWTESSKPTEALPPRTPAFNHTISALSSIDGIYTPLLPP
jgi:hypothetical protein